MDLILISGICLLLTSKFTEGRKFIHKLTPLTKSIRVNGNTQTDAVRIASSTFQDSYLSGKGNDNEEKTLPGVLLDMLCARCPGLSTMRARRICRMRYCSSPLIPSERIIETKRQLRTSVGLSPIYQ